MQSKSNNPIVSRRKVLKYGTAAAAMLAAPGWLGAALADTISDAEMTGDGPMAKIPKKAGPYRVGFSNGFSGNSWRAMCIAALKKEVAAHKEIADLVILDGQNDITKQINDIESLVTQQVDVILCIPNSGTAVLPALRTATKQGIVTVPFNLPVEGEDYNAYCGTDPSKKGHNSATWLRTALNGKGKIVALGGIPGNSYTAAGWKGAQEAFAGSAIEVLAFKDTDCRKTKPRS